MKICPHCRKELAPTAVRCRYCRKPLSLEKRAPIRPTAVNLEPCYPPWSLPEVLVLWLLVCAAIAAIGYAGIPAAVTDVLRSNYFIFIKEPALQFHLYIFVGTLLLKLAAIGFIWAILTLHKTRFIAGLNLDRPIKKQWLWLLPAFCIFAVALRLISDTDPLSPNLPVYLFFNEASAIGIPIILFSLSVVAPVSEEIFFRGFIYPGINKRLGLYWAVFITSCLFAAVHLPQCKEHPAILFTIFLAGVFLTLARAITGSTLMAVILHAVYNTTLVLVGFIKFLVLRY